MYCVESVVWWNKKDADSNSAPGSNSPGFVTKPERPTESKPKPLAPPDAKPVKVGMLSRPPRLGPF
jgi:hypothetical protein